ncbi:DUF6443 domain-containing protein [Kordia sp.]|uniref:DUF6443 domain-containing protein n=1 Tax=Kordia sp. TaxID=1965332 RepID=UPI003B5CF7BC
MKHFIACICMLASFGFVHAQPSIGIGGGSSPNGQEDIALPTIIPPAPTVAALMRFEEVPVDHYTGQPNISIPLGSVPMLDGMNYPISLQYNTQGIRVDERSGWLGTGFSMSTGGVISRTIRDIPDELNLADSGIGIFHNGYENFNSFSPAQRAEFLWNTDNGKTKYDSDHDMYQYSFFGKSGRFIIKKVNNQLIPVIIGAETNDKISLTYNASFEVTSFEIIDSSGYIYIFEESNSNLITSSTTTTSQFGNSSNTSTDFSSSQNVPNAWYLKEVKQPSGIILCSFSYQDVEENYSTPTSSVYNSLINQDINFGDPQVQNINKGMLLPRVASSSQNIQSTQKYVDQVTFYDGSKVQYVLNNGGHPEYNLSTQTTGNSITGTKLQSIIVTEPNGTEYKRINFSYETTTHSRLFLTKIEEVFGLKKLEYTLDYDHKEDLVGFGSDLKDSFGYFNDGIDTNAFISSKRRVNPTKITTGALTSITYPTGGKKEFVFESNTYSYQGAQPINPRTISENIKGQVREASLTGSGTVTESPEKVLIYIDSGQRININTVINGTGSGTILNNHKIIFSRVTPVSGNTNPPSVGSNNRLDYSPYNIANFQPVSSGYTRYFDINNQSTIETSIASGWYIIQMKTVQPYLSSESNNVSITTTIQYSTFDLKTRIKHGGGIRIKDILFTDDGITQTKTSFTYQDDVFIDPTVPRPVGADTSSGSFEVDFSAITHTKGKMHPFLVGYACQGATNSAAAAQTNLRTTVLANYLVRRDINQVLTPISKGNYVAYKKVYVSQQDAGGQLYTFISPRDIQILTTDNTTYPFTPLENNDYKRGMLEKMEVFDKDQNILVKQEYDYIDISTVAHTSILPYEAQDWDCPWDQFYETYLHFETNYVAQEYSLSLCGDDVSEPDVGTCYGSNPDMALTSYDHIRGIKLPSEVIKTDYFYDENDAVSQTVTTTKTLYNIKNRVKETTTEFAEGGNTTIYKEEVRYPYDYDASEYSSSEQADINKMVALNQISQPVQSKQYKNGVLIYDTQRIFKEFYPNVVKLAEIKSAKANTVKQSRVKFHGYTNLGQAIELSQTDGTRISYLWGYNSMYPIAKLENASYAHMNSEQTTAIAAAYTASNADVDLLTEEALQTALEDLRVKFPASMVTTLTYDPMIGTTRTTDPRGYTSYFAYDALHRLKNVKDADKNVLSANQYFYNNGDTTLDNYVKSTIYQKENHDLFTIESWDKIETINYADGLGRAKQAIGIAQGGNGEDIVTPFEYDDLGRQIKEFLPYATASLDGSIHTNAFVHQAAFYDTTKYENTTNPYSEKSLEDSPLARVLEQGAPGSAWQLDASSDTDHTIKMDYQTNSHNGVFTDMSFDNVKRFNVSYGANGFTDVSLTENGYYLAGELYKSIVKDENWQPNQTYENDHTVEEFKDKLGRVILKRTFNKAERHDTYYIYDDYGNLSYVLPPLVDASDGIDADELDKLCYQYKYDHRNRLIEKKLPAKEVEYIVYDKLDRPVLTQDPNLRAENKWLFTKYDVLGRVTYTGLVINTADRVALQTQMDTSNTHEQRTATATAIGNTSVFYTNANYPNDASVIVLTVNYYDDYNWDTENSLEANYNLNETNLTAIQNNTAWRKDSPTSWTNAGFITDSTIEGDGYIEYTVGNQGKRMMVGLSHQATASATNYNTINYRIYTGYNNNRVYVYNGTSTESITLTYSEEGDTFRVERYGTQILFKKNGAIFHTLNTSYTGTLVGSGLLCDNLTEIENVHVGYAVYGQSFTNNTKGLPTGGKIRTIGTNDWTTSESYYDDKAQPIHVTSKNKYLVTQDAVSSRLDFTGKVLESRTTHLKNGNSPIVTIDAYVYDENSRLLYQTKQVNGGDKELISRNHYDALGQLEIKQVGGSLPSISTYTNLVNTSASGPIITKTTGNSTWDAALTTTTCITGDGYISYQMPQDNKPVIVGLAASAGNSSYASMDYAIYTTSWGAVRVYENGVNKGDKTTYFTGDTFKIERRGSKIYYLKNGEIFYISDVTDSGSPLMGDVSIYSVGAQIKDLVLVDLEKELQEVDFTYTVRGWLKGINNVNDPQNDLFSFAITYNDITDPTKQLFNGNISSTLWKTKGQDSSLKNYIYQYDALNRITSATDNTAKYNLDLVKYDRNGNITNLLRKGHRDKNATDFGTMDNLSYQYTGNQLLNVTDDSEVSYGFNDGNVHSSSDATDANNDYKYDVNGNMISDKNKNINAITYNYLNLPTQITFDNGSTISYIYDASGLKLEKVVNDSSTSSVQNTYYAGNYIYKKSSSQSPVVLTFFNTEEGYIEPQFDPSKPTKIVGYNYTYQYKDHLGNIRLSYEDINGDGNICPETEIKEENHYYPFGLKHKGYNNQITGRDHQYGYNGKEEQNELSLNWSDYGARNYDASIGRWMNIDPLAEKYYDKSSYNYTLNNPIFFIDPNGETVDVTDLMNGGTDEDKWLLVQLMMNLSEISGETISTRKDKNRNTVLTTGDCKEDCNSSTAASSYISNLINDDSSVVKVKNNSRNTTVSKNEKGEEVQNKHKGSQAHYNGDIYLDANQIYSFQESLKGAGLNGDLMNTGFVFLHETIHTPFGASFYNSKLDNIEKDQHGRFPDTQGSFVDDGGPTVRRVNKFRKQMGLSRRLSYSSWNPKKPASIVFEKDGNPITVPIVSSYKFINSKKMF